MPAPAKLDLVPEELRRWLREELEARGFGDIVAVTEALNFRLEAEGLELSVGKSAVGRFSKALKDQREAFSLAETLLTDMDIEDEGELHKVLVQMIATSAVHMMQAVRAEDDHLDAKSLMNLGRMMKDLMASSGLREKLLADERARVARKAKEDAADSVARASAQLGLTSQTVQGIRAQILGVAA